jgi:prostaglandin-endoperoxide synthase 2
MSAFLKIARRFILPVAQKLFPELTQRLLINSLIRKERRARPHPFSLWTGPSSGKPKDGQTSEAATRLSPDDPATKAAATMNFQPSDYVSWTGLVNRRYTGRHLPPADPSYIATLPAKEEVFEKLLLREPGRFIPSDNTTTLFCFFAQWFTDSFLRTNPLDRRQNTSNHEIDYCQIYGLDGWTTNRLRERTDGRMLLENNLLPRLTTPHGEVRKQFHEIGYIRAKRAIANNQMPGAGLRAALGLSLGQPIDDQRWTHIYASGLERGNSTVLYTALSTMCVREHNHVASKIAAIFPDWGDDRLFETTRLVMIRNVLQIVVEDYINHIAGDKLFKLMRHFGERESWYRTNRISLEFNLLYRWHSLVPDTFTVGDQTYDHKGYRFNNAILEQHGVEECINAASLQPAGRVQLHNTPYFLRNAELATLDMSRTFALRPFVEYCERFGERPPETMLELVGGDARSAAELTALYGSVDKVELPIGLIAQTRDNSQPKATLPPLVTTMVAVDAFTHILTNPILADQVYEAAFPGPLAELADGCGGLAGLMARNAVPGTNIKPRFSLN